MPSEGTRNFQKELEQVLTPSQIKDGLYGKPLDEAREQYERILKGQLAKGHTAHKIAQTLRQIYSVGKFNPYYESALKHIDILSSLRRVFSDLSVGERTEIRNLLTEFARNENTSWNATRQALFILENPNHGIKLISEWIEQKTELKPDYMCTAEVLNGALITSLQNLPLSTRDEALALIHNSIVEADAKVKRSNLNSQETINAKEPIRNWQFLQQILLHREMLSTIETLQMTKASGNVDFLALEKFLLKLRRHEGTYGLKKVHEVAKALQSHLRSTLRPNEYIEIFGSFSNLLAKVGTSDIDAIFSARLDKIYYSIKDGFLGEGTFAATEAKSVETKELSKALLNAESEIRQILSSEQSPGALLSVSTLPRTYQHGMAVVEMPFREVIKFMTLSSPITIHITNKRITLRIYDGLSSIGDSPSQIFEFEM